jgi:hypothetical protein
MLGFALHGTKEGRRWEDYSDDAAAAFVVAAVVPIIWERWFTREELDSDPETSWMPEGTWAIDSADKRVHDFRLK